MVVVVVDVVLTLSSLGQVAEQNREWRVLRDDWHYDYNSLNVSFLSINPDLNFVLAHFLHLTMLSSSACSTVSIRPLSSHLPQKLSWRKRKDIFRHLSHWNKRCQAWNIFPPLTIHLVSIFWFHVTRGLLIVTDTCVPRGVCGDLRDHSLGWLSLSGGGGGCGVSPDYQDLVSFQSCNHDVLTKANWPRIAQYKNPDSYQRSIVLVTGTRLMHVITEHTKIILIPTRLHQEMFLEELVTMIGLWINYHTACKMLSIQN